MWVKFCGITQPADFAEAVRLGVDAIGIITVPSSPRCVKHSQLLDLASLDRGASKVVLVTQDQSHDIIALAVEALKPDLLQLHGDESPAECASFGLNYIKATRVQNVDVLDALTKHESAWAWLIDRKVIVDSEQNVYSLLAENPARRIIIAGGLTPQNVAERIAATSPFGVDVSSGIESAPGVKDHVKMKLFLKSVNAADKI